MNFTYENQGTNTFLEYEIQPTDMLDTMSLGMLTNNNIPGFAATTFTQMDNTRYIKYNVSSKISADQLFSGPVNRKRLLGFFTGIVDAILSAEEYMLDVNTMLLDLKYIFMDVSTCETVLVCLPILNAGILNPDLGMFFKNLMFTTQFDQTENCDHVAQILNYLNSNPNLSLEGFRAVLKSLSVEQAAPAPIQQVKTPEVKSVIQQVPVQTQVQPQIQTPVQQVIQPKQTVVPQPAQTVIPQPQNVPVPNNSPVQEKKGEKPMSWLYLMQHYSKENAAVYKAQKDAQKSQPAASKPEKKAKPAKQPKQPNPPAKQPGGMGFAIPGQVVTPTPSQTQVQPQQQLHTGQTAQTQIPVQPVITPEPVAAPVSAVTAMPLNFGETTVLGGGKIGETSVLSEAVQPKAAQPHLIRTKNNEKIPLNKPVFRIGKERSYVDYFIADNTAVSRSHANIINHNNGYFIMDTNSTNHTFVNGGMIQSNVETKLEHGAKIRLANEEFEFRMY